MYDIKLVLNTLIIILISLDCNWYEYTQLYFILFYSGFFKNKQKKNKKTKAVASKVQLL